MCCAVQRVRRTGREFSIATNMKRNRYYVIPTAKKRLPSYVQRQDGRLLLLAGFYEPLPDEGMGEGTC